MRVMLMMHAPRGTGDYQINEWKPEDLQAHMAFMHRLNKDLIAAGEFVQAEGLTPPDQARLVRSDKKGLPITDGPFPESKEFLAGFWILDVDRPQRAYEIAARVSTAPGPGGKPLYMPVEVRPVAVLPKREA